MHGWESDPLFAAAEVVQDSADRLESVFRLLAHEQDLVHGGTPDGKLQISIEHHKRDLATTLETAKWQLEDFEREVSVSATADNSRMKQDAITRHKQFIAAIREQIIHVEESIKTYLGSSSRSMELNEQDRDGLALFLSAGMPDKRMEEQESEDNSSLRRFLDPALSSNYKNDIDEPGPGESVSLNANEVTHLGHKLELKNNFSTPMDLGTSLSLQVADYDRCDENGTWDLEANVAEGKMCLPKNKPRGYCGRIKVIRSLGNFLPFHASRASRSFTKRLKDGEEQRQSPSYGDVGPGMQRYLAQLSSACGRWNFDASYSRLSGQAMHSRIWIRDFREKCQRSLHLVQVRYHPVLFVFGMLLTLVILSKCLSLF